MGFLATDIARIPSTGFDWYVYVLTDGWKDPMRDEIVSNFDQFSVAVGEFCLVVRGADPEGFYNGVMASELMAFSTAEVPPLPALIVSNCTPVMLDDSTGIKNLDAVSIMIFPLCERYVQSGSITNFLKALANTLKDGNIDDLDKDTLRSKWQWLVDYLELKPSFFGVGVNLNEILNDLFPKTANS